MANNPSMAAVAQALDPGTGNQALVDLRLFALGTGDNPTFIEGESLDWGISQWARTIVSLMIDGTMGVADYQCARLLGNHYHRLAPPLEEPIALDAKDKTDELIAIAQAVELGPAIDWLQNNF
jgi:hypothetical protein